MDAEWRMRDRLERTLLRLVVEESCRRSIIFPAEGGSSLSAALKTYPRGSCGCWRLERGLCIAFHEALVVMRARDNAAVGA